MTYSPVTDAPTDQAVNYNSEGTWGRSSEAGGETYIIFASHVDSDTVQAFLVQNEINYRTLFGVYKGAYETSYIINRNAFPFIELSGILAEQESILELGPIGTGDKRPTKLVFKDQSTKDLGFMTEVTREEAFALAQNEGGFTYDPALKKFFSTK